MGHRELEERDATYVGYTHLITFYSKVISIVYFEGLEPKGPICIFGEMRFWYQNDPFNTENHFFMLTNTYNTSMA